MSDNKRLGKHLENLSEDAKIYIESEIAYQKLDLYKKLINATSLLLKFIVNSSILLLAFAFLFIGLSLLLGYLLGYYFVGFLIVSGMLFFITILMVAYGKPIFEKRVLKMFNSIFGDLKP
jgi:hypothetical protein